MIDRRIHDCATEIDALPVKPPYDEFKTMVHYILAKYIPNVSMNTVRKQIKTNWKSRSDGHMGATEP